MGNPALFKGLIAGAGQSVSLSFSHGSNELTGVAYRIQPSQLAAARQVLGSRLGAPCYVTANQTAWVDGDAFVVLHNNSMAVLLARAYRTIIDRFDTCPPTD